MTGRTEMIVPKRIQYNIYNRCIQDLMLWLEDGSYYVPDYQRPYIWNQEQKELLIDSILSNLPIGNIFLNEIKLAIYEIVDGQQRLLTIQDFLNDKFTYQGKLYSELDSACKWHISNFTIATYTTYFTERKSIIELFYRLNWAGTPHSIEDLIKVDKEMGK